MTQKYTLALRALHWASAFMIVMQLGLVALNNLIYEARPVMSEALVQAHISLGAIVFATTLVRLALRAVSRTPPGSKNRGLRVAANASHLALYLALLALPVSGFLKLAALGFSVELFGFLPLAQLPVNVELARASALWHSRVAIALLALVTLHICAALFHVRLDGRAVIQRMSI